MAELARRIHLDPLGGIAGDMFAAALVDTFPALEAGVLAAVRALPAPNGAVVRFEAHRDAVLGGRRFLVSDPTAAEPHHDPESGAPKRLGATKPRQHAHEHAHEHGHRDYASIRTLLERAPLEAPVRAHAQALFALLADVEARVHGIAVNEVTFHEVGAWDSIVDFVAAAYIVDAVGSARWSWSALPLGGGRIRSAHGVLPVPAPATALLMQGMTTIDDGITGERVTPTGATILRYLKERGHGEAVATPLVTATTGHGFGTRVLPGVSNVLRCIAFTTPTTAPGTASAAASADERVSLLNFEIDDQSGEDLAIALDRLRAAEGVLDVTQSAAMGKKGRIVTAVQLQVRPEHTDAVADLVFLETTTIGLRVTDATRRVLARTAVAGRDSGVRVKVAQRPQGGATAKGESDDVAAIAGFAARAEARAAAELQALRALVTGQGE